MPPEKKEHTGIMYGRAIVKPETLDRVNRTVDIVFATQTPVFRFGWDEDFNEVLLCDADHVKMERINNGLPLLDCHNSTSVFNQFGRSSDVWFKDGEAWARVHFSKRAEVENLFQDIEDGIVADISVGYNVFAYEREQQQNDKIPTYRAIEWMPFEISLQPVQADINSGTRSGNMENKIKIINKLQQNNKSMKTRKDSTTEKMDYTVEDAPVKAGDIINTGDVEGVALTDGEVGATIQLAVIPKTGGDAEETQAAADAAQDAADAAANAADAAQAAADAAQDAADATSTRRMDAILLSTRAAKLPDSAAIDLFKSKKTVAECRQEIITRAAKNDPAIIGSHRAGVGVTAIEKKRGAIQDVILYRVAPGAFPMKDKTNEFFGMSLIEMSKELLTERGISIRGMGKQKIADHVFGTRAHSTSDFPNLLGGVISRMLLADYEFAPEYWDRISRQTSVNDFRAKAMYRLEKGNGMKEIAEGGEIKYSTLTETKDTIRVKSFGEGILFTRQAFINDDLGAFEIIPKLFIQDWNETRGDAVWGLLIDNVKMSDGNALFSTAHKNILTGAASALSAASLANAQVLMKKQTAAGGSRRIRTIPRFLIVPAELEVLARQLMTQITPTKTEDVNVLAGDFDIIVEPRLTNPIEWYLSADPKAVDSVLHAYLDGEEGLRSHTEDDFSTDTMKFGVRGEFGTAAVDHKGLVKSNGK